MIDLTALPDRYLSVLGRERVADIVGVKMPMISMWVSRKRFPLDAVQKLIEFDPSQVAEIKPLYSNPPAGTKLMILVPLSSPPQPKMMDSLVRLFDRREMSYERFGFNNLSVSRNVLAARLIRSPCQWGFWMDGDSMLPAGDSEWFKREAELPLMSDTFAGINSIYRLLVHSKTIMSCVYIGRRKGAQAQFGGGEAMRDKIRRGPRDEVIEVPWVGFGGVLTHRKVFEDIIRTQGDEIRMKSGGIGSRFGYEYSFFTPTDRETPGDDIPFCQRALKAGHKIHVDLAVQCAHLGDRPYTYMDT